MPPPKQKLHKTTGKPKTLPPLITPAASTSNDMFDTNSEIARQFELELCWCIQQLQTSIKNGKLNPKQTQDTTKILNTLMSNSAPMIKKRQIMRLSFGDYRAKMAAEDKKFQSVNTKIKVNSVTPSNKSVFIKKSSFGQSGNDFRFDFTSISNTDLADDMSNVKLDNDKEEDVTIETFKFTPSDNKFQFNFNFSDND